MSAAIDTTKATGATITGIENVVLTSNAAIKSDASKWTGATSITSLGGATELTAAATTNVNATSTGDVSVSGGNSVTATASAGKVTIADAAGAVAVTTVAQAGNNVAVDGGTSVAVTAAGVTTGTVTVGATTAPTGAVAVSVAGDYTDGTALAIGATKVTGGSSVSVSQASGITAAEIKAALNDKTNETVTQGAVTVTGTSTTTTVTVTQEAARTKADSKTGADGLGVIGVAVGDVTVYDVNRASTTKAGAISSVSLTNFGAAEINSGALAVLTLSGKGATVDADTLGALAKGANTTLALNLNGFTSSGVVEIDADITTLNVTGSSASSKLAELKATGVTALNISGDKAVTLTAQTTDTAVITSTNTAGVTLGTALATGSQFVGAAGADTITLTTSFTKAHSMGGGDDTVNYASAGKGGSVNFGDGSNDALVIASADAATADDTTALNSTFTNFEVLALSDALGAATTLNIDTLGGVSKIVLSKGGADAATAVLDNLASGATIDTRSTSTGFVAQVKGALTGTADVVNVKLTNSTAATVGFGSVTAANVETVTLATVDTGTSANVAATIDTVTLVATSATSVTVSGNNGLNLTNTGNTAITNFNASGVVADTAPDADGNAIDTAANLGVTFTSANTSTKATVTITGGDGNDTLTGNASKDVIVGGAGNDTIDGASGDDTISGGAGNDALTGGSGDDTIDGGAGNDTITGGLGADSVTLGTGRDTAVFADGDSTAAAPDTVNGFGLTSAAIDSTLVAVDLTGTNFGTSKAGGTEVDRLDLAGVVIEANVTTAAGQAAGVTYSIADGILTLGGAGASAIDTLGEWLTEASAIASASTETLAFQFGGDTYVFQNGTADTLVKLAGITGVAGLAVADASTDAGANYILIG